MRALYFLFALLLVGICASADEIQLQPIEPSDSLSNGAFSKSTQDWPTQENPGAIYLNDERTLEENLANIGGIDSLARGPIEISMHGLSPAQQITPVYADIPLSGLLINNSILIPQEKLQRIQIFREPSTMLWGSGPTGGALNFVSERFNHPTVRAGGQTIGFSRLDQNQIFAAIPVWQDTNHQLQMTGYSDDGWLNRFTLDGNQKWGAWQLQETALTASGGGFDANLQQAGSLVALIARRALDNEREIYFRSAGIFENEHVLNPSESSYGAQTFLNSLGLRFPLSESMRAEISTDWRSQNLQTSQASYSDDQVEVAGQVLMPVQDWTAQTGVRYLAAYGDLAAAFSLIRQRDGKTWITYSEGIRPASLAERYVSDDVFKANIGLKPQVARTVELGYLKRPQDFQYTREGFIYGGSFSSTTYMDRWDYDASSGSYMRVNAGTATLFGVDLNAGYSYSVWTIEATAEFLQAQTAKLPRSSLSLFPKTQATLATSMQLGPLIGELRALYWSPYLAPKLGATNTIEENPGTTCDLNVRTLGFNNWQIRAGIFNLFNSSRELTDGALEPGRRYYVSAQRQF